MGIGLSGGIQGVLDEFYMFNHALAAYDIADISEQCNLGAGEKNFFDTTLTSLM